MTFVIAPNQDRTIEQVLPFNSRWIILRPVRTQIRDLKIFMGLDEGSPHWLRITDTSKPFWYNVSKYNRIWFEYELTKKEYSITLEVITDGDEASARSLSQRMKNKIL